MLKLLGFLAPASWQKAVPGLPLTRESPFHLPTLSFNRKFFSCPAFVVCTESIGTVLTWQANEQLTSS